MQISTRNGPSDIRRQGGELKGKIGDETPDRFGYDLRSVPESLGPPVLVQATETHRLETNQRNNILRK